MPLIGSAAAASALSEDAVSDALHRLRFVENQGQWETPAQFVAWSAERVVRIERDGMWLQFTRSDSESRRGVLIHVVFEGASESTEILGEAPESGVVSFFLGPDPRGWHTGIHPVSRIRYRGLWEGIDLVLREGPVGLHYDLEVAPGADLSRAILRFDGVDAFDFREDGSARVEAGEGVLHQTAPRAWQVGPNGQRIATDSTFVRHGERSFGFAASGRDASLAMVVDPGITWSTYLGGSETDTIEDMVVDDAQRITVTGMSCSADFPTTPGTIDETHAPNSLFDVFVSRIDPSGPTLEYSTYLGGFQEDAPNAIAVGPSGSTAICGVTESQGFPTSVGAFDTHLDFPADGSEGFVAKIDPSGTFLEYSTFLGSTGDDSIRSIAMSPNGEVTVAGSTLWSDYPTTDGVLQPNAASPVGGGLVATRLAADGKSLVWSTYLPVATSKMALRPDGSLVLAGAAGASGLPTGTGAFQTTIAPSIDGAPDQDAYISVLSSEADAILAGTYFGGNGSESTFALDLDGAGNIYIVGESRSTDLPTTIGAVQPNLIGVVDGFVAKFDSNLTMLHYATYLGGTEFVVSERVRSIAVDAGGVATVVSDSPALDFVTTPGALQEAVDLDGGILKTITRLSPAGDRRFYSSYVQGIDGSYQPEVVRLYGHGSAAVAGWTRDTAHPVTSDAIQSIYGGNGATDGYITIFDFLPTGVERYGGSSGACIGEVIPLGATRMPVAGDPEFSIYASGAPLGGLGFLLVGGTPDVVGLPLFGIDLHVSLFQQPVLLLASPTPGAGGFAEQPMPLPAPSMGKTIYAQLLWIDAGGCGSAGTWSASNALEITVQ